ncbi:class F sortase [Curtobacterium sp. 1544]|uniref:class F sortase n=1 Tax=Curtobacterium sp. 1544 TaxID=3156417 RepID=UPI003399F014
MADIDAVIASKPKRRRWWFLVIGVAAVAAIVLGVLGATGAFTRTDAPKDLRGNPVQYDPDATPNPRASAVPSGHGRFVAKSVNLNVPLGALDATDGVVTPPGFTSAYLIRNYGVDPSRAGLGAVYVVMHSLRNGAIGPGNALIDVDKERAKIRKGATITVDDVTYTVTGTEAVTKTQLPSSKIWSAGRNQLVVITCLQRPQGGPSIDNIVITATRST